MQCNSEKCNKYIFRKNLISKRNLELIELSNMNKVTTCGLHVQSSITSFAENSSWFTTISYLPASIIS
jgi:hypothetical protein